MAKLKKVDLNNVFTDDELEASDRALLELQVKFYIRTMMREYKIDVESDDEKLVVYNLLKDNSKIKIEEIIRKIKAKRRKEFIDDFLAKS
jgi:hypothetical protein